MSRRVVGEKLPVQGKPLPTAPIPEIWEVPVKAWEQLDDGILVRPSLLYKTQTVLLRTPEALWVVDPGYFEEEIEDVRARAEALARPGQDRFLLLTHSDYDHVMGVRAFQDHASVVSAHWDETLAKRGQEEGRHFDEALYIDRPWGTYRSIRRDIAIGVDGETVGGLRLFPTPGHTPDGLAAHDPNSGTVLAGDYLSDVEFPFCGHDMGAYLTTFVKLARLILKEEAAFVISGHGPVAHGRAEWAPRIRHGASYLLAVIGAAGRGAASGRRETDVAAEIAEETDHAWRGRAFPEALRPAHLENARHAIGLWREGGPPSPWRTSLQRLQEIP